MKVIDLHSHILPELDDGSRCEEETIEMAKIAVSEGISKIVVTPHHRKPRYLAKKEDILRKITYINKRLKEENIDLDIYTGMEIHMSRDIPEKLKNNELLSLNGSGYILIELPMTGELDYAEDVLHEIRVLGYIPVIAHPERYEKVIKDPNYVKELIESGCLIQINSNSLTGHFGKESKKTAEILVKHKMVHLVCTDAHSSTRRSPRLKEGIERVKRLNGEEYVDIMMSNADKVFNNKDIEVDYPLTYKQSKGIFKKATKFLRFKKEGRGARWERS